MTEMRDIEKRPLFENLDRCLKELLFATRGRYMDEQVGAVGLIYLLFCHHYGLESRLPNGMLRWILEQEKKECINPDDELLRIETDLLSNLHGGHDLFLDKNAEPYRIFLQNYIYLSDKCYCEVIDYIVNFIQTADRYGAMYGTTPDMTELIDTIAQSMGTKSVFDPCAGICNLACSPLMKDVRFFGQEINALASVLARVRLLAHEIEGTCITANSCSHWPNDLQQFDTLVSELPLGSYVPSEEAMRELGRPGRRMIDDIFMHRFLMSPIRKCVMLVPMSFCYRRENFDIRKELVERKNIRAIIALPAGAIRNIAIPTCLVVIDKLIKGYSVKLVGASDCMEITKKSRRLDVQTIIERYLGGSKVQTYDASIEELFDKDCDLTPARYIEDYSDVMPGQKLVEIGSVATIKKGEIHFEEKRGRLLNRDKMHTSIVEIPFESESDDVQNVPIADVQERKHRKVDFPCVIFNTDCKYFFVKGDESPLFITPSYSCFSVDADKCDLKYFIHVMLTSQHRKEAATIGVMRRIKFDSLRLPIYEDVSSQRSIIGRLYREQKSNLEEKLSGLAKLGDGSQSLIHDLGFTFTKISAGLSLLTGMENKDVIADMKANVAFALRQINRKGTDFANVVPSLIEHDIVALIKQYIEAWRAFGYNNFSIDELNISGFDTSEETLVLADEELFYSMLDCVFLNAYQHGFLNNPSSEHRISIQIKAVSQEEKRYALISIANNGEPLPVGFTSADFVQRGVVGSNSTQDGIGGDHINKIAHKHGGKVNIYQNEEWCCCDILIPVYLTSQKSNFVEYESDTL